MGPAALAPKLSPLGTRLGPFLLGRGRPPSPTRTWPVLPCPGRIGPCGPRAWCGQPIRVAAPPISPYGSTCRWEPFLDPSRTFRYSAGKFRKAKNIFHFSLLFCIVDAWFDQFSHRRLGSIFISISFGHASERAIMTIFGEVDMVNGLV